MLSHDQLFNRRNLVQEAVQMEAKGSEHEGLNFTAAVVELAEVNLWNARR
jgi:hypothetical protein